MLKRIRGLIRGYQAGRKYRRILKSNKHLDTVYFDIGSTYCKCAFKSTVLNFKSSIREVEKVQITPAINNWIEVDGRYFVIGESTKANEVFKRKYLRTNINILVLYGIKLLKEKKVLRGNDIKINMLVPSNELQYKKVLETKLNGMYLVDGTETSITLNKLFCEGESSGVYFKEKYNYNGNLGVVNIGGYSTDVIVINSSNATEKVASISTGVQSLLSELTRFVDGVPNSNILSSWLNDGYLIKETSEVKEVKKQFAENIYFDVVANAIKTVNPDNLRLVFTGGGALLLEKELKEVLKDYKIVVLSKEEATYSDLLGAIALDNNNVIEVPSEAPREEIKEVEEVIAEEVMEKAEEVQKNVIELLGTKEKDLKLTNEKSKYDICSEYFDAGFTNKDIMEKIDVAYQTLKNYRSKWNKSRVV